MRGFEVARALSLDLDVWALAPPPDEVESEVLVYGRSLGSTSFALVIYPRLNSVLLVCSASISTGLLFRKLTPTLT
jgi:hypothetical protein